MSFFAAEPYGQCDRKQAPRKADFELIARKGDNGSRSVPDVNHFGAGSQKAFRQPDFA